MANFRAMAFSINEKKVAELIDVTTKIMTNGEQQIGTDEVLGESVGIVTLEASWNHVEPVEGTEIDFDDLLISQVPVNLSYQKGGKIYRIDGKIIDGETKSTMKSGVTTGTYNFRGGKPRRVG
jgi:hypothetical protein